MVDEVKRGAEVMFFMKGTGVDRGLSCTVSLFLSSFALELFLEVSVLFLIVPSGCKVVCLISSVTLFVTLSFVGLIIRLFTILFKESICDFDCLLNTDVVCNNTTVGLLLSVVVPLLDNVLVVRRLSISAETELSNSLLFPVFSWLVVEV